MDAVFIPGCFSCFAIPTHSKSLNSIHAVCRFFVRS